jgi:hypothetical protein
MINVKDGFLDGGKQYSLAVDLAAALRCGVAARPPAVGIVSKVPNSFLLTVTLPDLSLIVKFHR